MQTELWNKNIFNGIKAVNRNRFHNQGGLPAKASALLYQMECCLCSGDGLSPETAFCAESRTAMERVLGLLGVRMKNPVGFDDENSEGVASFPVYDNLFGVRTVYFSIADPAGLESAYLRS